jgi:hypothetical protein
MSMMPWERWHESRLGRLLDAGATAAELAEYLDGLPGRERVVAALAVTGSGIGRLYDAVAAAPPLALEQIVAADAAPSATFIYEGRNSLPSFNRFQKRFARSPAGRLIGHNHQTWSPLTGPGYFVVSAPNAREVVPDEPFFDYTVAPEHEPTGWPRYRPNEWGPSRLVFAGMKDFVRQVARGVIVGRAFKGGAAIGQYFTLARAD